MRMWVVVIFVAAMVSTGLAQAGPEYEVRNNVIRHKGGGGYEIEVAKDLKYLGATRFHIRQAADAEQHLFAEADANGHLKRLVWVQVEQQLPGQTWRYDYPSPERTRLGELEFITDSRAFRSYVAEDPKSDHGMVDKKLAEHKLSWAGPAIGLRMIYLPDAEKRRELMIIYMEALPQTEKTKFRENEADAGQWPKELAKAKADAMRDVKVKLVK